MFSTRFTCARKKPYLYSLITIANLAENDGCSELLLSEMNRLASFLFELSKGMKWLFWNLCIASPPQMGCVHGQNEQNYACFHAWLEYNMLALKSMPCMSSLQAGSLSHFTSIKWCHFMSYKCPSFLLAVLFVRVSSINRVWHQVLYFFIIAAFLYILLVLERSDITTSTITISKCTITRSIQRGWKKSCIPIENLIHLDLHKINPLQQTRFWIN
jgi:hypothetical protein